MSAVVAEPAAESANMKPVMTLMERLVVAAVLQVGLRIAVATLGLQY